MHRPRLRSADDRLVVHHALATGSHLPRGSSASWFRDATTVVRVGDPANTPALLGLFSLVTLFAHRRMMKKVGAVRRSAWYDKTYPTFADALALVRAELWAHSVFYGSSREADTVKVPRAFLERLTDAVCYAA